MTISRDIEAYMDEDLRFYLVCTELNYHARALNNLDVIIQNWKASADDTTAAEAAASYGVRQSDIMSEERAAAQVAASEVMKTIKQKEDQQDQVMASVRRTLNLGYELPCPPGSVSGWRKTTLATVKSKDWSLPNKLGGASNVLVAS
jgi:hypothetical protein